MLLPVDHYKMGFVQVKKRIEKKRHAMFMGCCWISWYIHCCRRRRSKTTIRFFYLVLFLHCFRLPNAIIRPTIIINVQIFPVRWYAHTIQQQSIRLFLLQFLENSDNVFTECPIVCEFSIRFHTLLQFFFSLHSAGLISCLSSKTGDIEFARLIN